MSEALLVGHDSTIFSGPGRFVLNFSVVVALVASVGDLESKNQISASKQTLKPQIRRCFNGFN